MLGFETDDTAVGGGRREGGLLLLLSGSSSDFSSTEAGVAEEMTAEVGMAALLGLREGCFESWFWKVGKFNLGMV